MGNGGIREVKEERGGKAERGKDENRGKEGRSPHTHF